MESQQQNKTEALPLLCRFYHDKNCLQIKTNVPKLVKEEGQIKAKRLSFLLTVGNDKGYNSFQVSKGEMLEIMQAAQAEMDCQHEREKMLDLKRQSLQQEQKPKQKAETEEIEVEEIEM